MKNVFRIFILIFSLFNQNVNSQEFDKEVTADLPIDTLPNNSKLKEYIPYDTVEKPKLLFPKWDKEKSEKFFRFAKYVTGNYWYVDKFDIGPIYSFIRYNHIENWRIKLGGRTNFGLDDKWRVEGYGAYGIKDKKFKYGVSAKVLLEQYSRLIAHIGYRDDLDHLSSSFSPVEDVLDVDITKSVLLANTKYAKLSDMQRTRVGFEVELMENFRFLTSFDFRKMNPVTDFNFAYYEDIENKKIRDAFQQSEIRFSLDYSPGKQLSGKGVERKSLTDRYLRIYLNYTKGLKSLWDSPFAYEKIQFYYKYPIKISNYGIMTTSVEAGKVFGTVPLAMLAVVPGNQTYYTIPNAFHQIDYYEFVTDSYAAFHLQHNFQGKLLSKIALLKKIKMHEIVGVRSVIGSISQDNININASPVVYNAPTKMYREYFVAIGNIFDLFRVDFTWRGNYLEREGVRRFGVKATFAYYF